MKYVIKFPIQKCEYLWLFEIVLISVLCEAFSYVRYLNIWALKVIESYVGREFFKFDKKKYFLWLLYLCFNKLYK